MVSKGKCSEKSVARGSCEVFFRMDHGDGVAGKGVEGGGEE